MTRLVVDASVAAAWLLPHQSTERAAELLDRIDAFELEAPHLFAVEVRNVLLVSERRRRAAKTETDAALTLLRNLNVSLQTMPDDLENDVVLDLARQEHLTVYDALYLRHALTRNAALATRDAELLAAAQRRGVTVWDVR